MAIPVITSARNGPCNPINLKCHAYKNGMEIRFVIIDAIKYI